MSKIRRFKAIEDRFTTLTQVTEAIKEQGLETCSLIFGIDYTMSNNVQGEKTFHGKSLHCISEAHLNPYQQVIQILGETLEAFDDDGYIPTFGFGDIRTKDQGIFAMPHKGNQNDGFKSVLETYNRITPTVKLHRPTNFAPLIKKAIEIVCECEPKKYHILVIVADGQVTSEEETTQAIVEASRYPLSIIVIGVGDGPWGMMQEFDDNLPARHFDNFQFVNFHEVMSAAVFPPAALALHALMEIPDQYKAIKRLGLIRTEQRRESNIF